MIIICLRFGFSPAPQRETFLPIPTDAYVTPRQPRDGRPRAGSLRGWHWSTGAQSGCPKMVERWRETVCTVSFGRPMLKNTKDVESIRRCCSSPHSCFLDETFGLGAKLCQVARNNRLIWAPRGIISRPQIWGFCCDAAGEHQRWQCGHC